MNLFYYIWNKAKIEQQLQDLEIELLHAEQEREKQRELKNKYYKELKSIKEKKKKKSRRLI